MKNKEIHAKLVCWIKAREDPGNVLPVKALYNEGIDMYVHGRKLLLLFF